jgi:hypothetical protein
MGMRCIGAAQNPARRDALKAPRIRLIEDVNHDGVLILLPHPSYSSDELFIVLRPQGGVVRCGGILRQMVVDEDHEAVVDHLHGVLSAL